MDELLNARAQLQEKDDLLALAAEEAQQMMSKMAQMQRLLDLHAANKLNTSDDDGAPTPDRSPTADRQGIADTTLDDDTQPNGEVKHTTTTTDVPMSGNEEEIEDKSSEATPRQSVSFNETVTGTPKKPPDPHNNLVSPDDKGNGADGPTST